MRKIKMLYCREKCKFRSIPATYTDARGHKYLYCCKCAFNNRELAVEGKRILTKKEQQMSQTDWEYL